MKIPRTLTHAEATDALSLMADEMERALRDAGEPRTLAYLTTALAMQNVCRAVTGKGGLAPILPPVCDGEVVVAMFRGRSM
jgi:hypothetical protein